VLNAGVGIPQRTAWAITRRQPGWALWTARIGIRSISSAKSIPQTLIEEIIEKERFQLRVFLVGCGDIIEEDTLYMESNEESSILALLH
jgi:hypothetical protein